MLNKIRNIPAIQWFIIILAALFITDLIIIMDLPFLRNLIPFLYFSIVPGFLILLILKISRLEFITKTVLSVGLSISLLMIMGLLLNSLYPILTMPLSLIPVLLSLNIIMVILTVSAYKRNKNDFNTDLIFNYDIKIGDKIVSPLIFPIIFPLIAVLGTYLMNTSQNNILLMVMLFLIPVYLVIVTYLKDRIHPATYPVALLMIGLGLIFMHALTSVYVIGRDVHQEFGIFQLTLSNFHWDIYDLYTPYNACLSITILRPPYIKLFQT